MKKIKHTFVILFVVFFYTGQLLAQTVKVAVMYTEAVAKNRTQLQQEIKDQVGIIREVLTKSGITNIDIDLSVLELDTYREPKHRDLLNKYSRFSFNGTMQMLDEVSNQSKLLAYFDKTGANTIDENGVNYIDKNQLSQSFIGLGASAKYNVLLVIADEDGPPIVSEYFPENLTGRASRPFVSIINFDMFKRLPISLALGFFGIFTSRADADLDDEDNPANSSLMSFWEYDDPNVKRELSIADKGSFTCKLSKLELIAPEKLSIGGMQVNLYTNSVVHAFQEVSIAPGSEVNGNENSFFVAKRAFNGEDSFVAIVNKRTKLSNNLSCPMAVGNKLGSENIEFLPNNEEEILAQPEAITRILPPYPNPTSGALNFDMYIEETGFYKLALYNIITGQEMVVVHNGNLEKGVHKLETNVSNLSAGLYIYRLESNSLQAITGKIIVK